jgi:hypothetical protein
MQHTRIIQLNALPPQNSITLLRTPKILATLMPGPLQYQYTVPVRNQGVGFSGIAMATETSRTGEGCFLVISYNPLPDLLPLNRAEPALAISENLATLKLEYPTLLGTVIFDGIINDGSGGLFLPEGPVTLTTLQELDGESLSQFMQKAQSDLSHLSDEDRERFRLAARWFMRGHETLNPVDKLLYWFISLEVYPGKGQKVVKQVQTLISTKVYPNMDPGEVKRLLMIGHIDGLRNDIVHHGLSHIDLPQYPKFDQAIQRLGEITAVSLRLLVGLPPGNGLDKWIYPETTS